MNMASLTGILAALTNDGKQELLVRTPLTPYLGATAAQAGWTAIYSWNGPLLIDNTAAFVNYYESSILPGLKSKADQLAQSNPGSLPAAIAEIEYDKALRVTGQNPQAGLNEALAWAGSADPNYRILASAVFADIATPTAVAALTKLASDSNAEVATYVKSESAQSADLHYMPVQIDIKPGDPNKNVNLKSQGSIPVAILSSSTFSAPNMVDVKSLTFGSSGNEPSLVSCAPEDVNNNEVFDLMCHFDTQTASFQITDVEGILKGKLKDGSAIKGVDVINPNK